LQTARSGWCAPPRSRRCAPLSSFSQERHSYFAALVASGETSGRAHALTTQLIALNGADYSAWHWRWLCVQAAEAGGGDAEPLLEELRFTEEYAEENAKNYQLWNHRRLVAAALGARDGRAAGAREDSFTAAVLADDAKNYHAWAHRSWAVATFGMLEQELAFTEALLTADGRNNSAWNARRAALLRAAAPADPPPALSDAALRAEMALACGHIMADSGNEAAWAYAAALARDDSAADAHLQRCAADTLAAQPDNALAAGVLAEAAEARSMRAAADGRAEEAAGAAAEAARLFTRCAAADPIRAPYWTFRAMAGEMEAQAAALCETAR